MDTQIRVHSLQHVPFEDSANIGLWAENKGHVLTRTRLYENEPFPDLDSFDMLVIMGGLMNVYEYDTYPWLLRERQFIRHAIEQKKAVLGVCLGAQLLADILGARVKRNRHREIGWHPVKLTPRGRRCSLFDDFPGTFMAFQWHGDTFSLPARALLLARSRGCTNQAFLYGDRVLGLQFHLEYSAESIQRMLKHCAHEMVRGPYTQQAEEIKRGFYWVKSTETMLFRILDRLEALLLAEQTISV